MRFTSQGGFITVVLLAAECHGRLVPTTDKFSATSHVKAKTSAVGKGTSSAVVKETTSSVAVKGTSSSSAATASSTTTLDPNAVNCFITVPNNPLSATGLSTPYLLQPPCSMAETGQQAFAEAAILDPTTGQISIYHPLVSNAGTPPAAAPVVPTLPAGAVVGLWFGFNGGVLQLLDENGQNANNSTLLKAIDCVNGLPGVQGDVFGQVSWCNAETWFTAANKAISSGQIVISDLGVDKLGNACPTSRSFEITDACPSDNVPTQYILNGEATAQDNAANEKALPDGEIINNASDEALLTNIIDPLIGCTPFLAPSLDNPGAMVPALALSELQAAAKQAAPIGLVPLNDPDTLLTLSGAVSVSKTNNYRLGVNQPVIGTGADSGALVPYCQDMVSVAPPFFQGFETVFTGQTTPDTAVGNNLFTFMCNRYLQSLTQLTCPNSSIPVQPVVCQTDSTGAATSCTITLSGNTASTGGNANGSTTSEASLSSTTSIKGHGEGGGKEPTSIATIAASLSTSKSVKENGKSTGGKSIAAAETTPANGKRGGSNAVTSLPPASSSISSIESTTSTQLSHLQPQNDFRGRSSNR